MLCSRNDIKGMASGQLNVAGAVNLGLKAEVEKLAKTFSEHGTVEISYYATDIPDAMPTDVEKFHDVIAGYTERMDKTGVPLEVSNIWHHIIQ